MKVAYSRPFSSCLFAKVASRAGIASPDPPAKRQQIVTSFKSHLRAFFLSCFCSETKGEHKIRVRRSKPSKKLMMSRPVHSPPPLLLAALLPSPFCNDDLVRYPLRTSCVIAITMGISSGKRQSGIKKMKQKARKQGATRATVTSKALLPGIDRRVDNGGKNCKRCARGPGYKQGHDPTCPGSKHYLAHGGTVELQRQWRSEQNNSSSAPTFDSSEMCHAITGNRHAKVTRFVRGNSDEMIAELKASRRWRRRYGKYIARYPYSKDVVNENLRELWIELKVDNSPGEPEGRGRVVGGKKVLTVDSKKAFEAAYKTSEYVQDCFPQGLMYREENPSSNSKHGIPVRRSKRPESVLESIHDACKGWCNVGMRETLADSISLQGSASYNASVREGIRVSKLSSEEIAKIPYHLRKLPVLEDELRKKHINAKLAEVGLPPVYESLVDYCEDNGESFFYQCYRMQEERNKMRVESDSPVCQCPECFPLD